MLQMKLQSDVDLSSSDLASPTSLKVIRYFLNVVGGIYVFGQLQQLIFMAKQVEAWLRSDFWSSVQICNDLLIFFQEIFAYFKWNYIRYFVIING